MTNHYATLGISSDASEEEIKNSYRLLARQFHPDTNQGSTESEAKFKEIHASYTVLMDPISRQRFDAKLNSSKQGAQSHVPEDAPYQRNPMRDTTFRRRDSSIAKACSVLNERKRTAYTNYVTANQEAQSTYSCEHSGAYDEYLQAISEARLKCDNRLSAAYAKREICVDQANAALNSLLNNADASFTEDLSKNGSYF